MPEYRKGERVKHPKRLEWGIGQVLYDSIGGNVHVYFLWARKKIIRLQYVELIRLQGEEAISPILDIIGNGRLSHGHHNVYVIELNKEVLKDWKFRNANPNYDPSKPCVYVGLTGLSPEERFENHKIGHKSSFYAHRYGERLLHDEFKGLNPMSYQLAVLMEAELANKLRSLGYAVWWN